MVSFSYVLLFLILLETCFVNGDFSLRVQFHRYGNPSRRDANGNCCDRTLIGCGSCETLFQTLCLRNGGISDSTSGQCISGTRTNPGRVGSDNIEFGNTIGSISNPFTYTRTVSIRQGGYQVHLEVFNDDPFNDDFIDRIIVDIPGHVSSVQSGTYQGVRNRVSLVLSYILSCARHYYNTDCSVNCIPQNNAINGHYTCNTTTGAIMCRSGWQNITNNCRDVACHLVCTSPGGQCTPNGVCQCNNGWTGSQCSIPQCREGCHHTGGYCTVPNTCICHNNWNGTNCDMALCAVSCNTTGGVCHVRNQCTCLSGYTGSTCDIDMLPCDHQRPCRNNATCTHTDNIGGYYCYCPIGYTGHNCETDIDECSNNPCHNNGTCVNSEPGNYRCICTTGWTGENCTETINYCQIDPCINNGTCTNQLTGYYCHCPIQYEGVNCELTVNACLSNPCHNNGTCTDMITSYTCTCLEGYTGIDCKNIRFSSTTFTSSLLQYTITNDIKSYTSIQSNISNTMQYTLTTSESLFLTTKSVPSITTMLSIPNLSVTTTNSVLSIYAISSTVQEPLPSVGKFEQSSITVSVTGGIIGLLLLIIISIIITILTLVCVIKQRKQLKNKERKIQNTHYIDDKTTSIDNGKKNTFKILSDYEEPRVLRELHNTVHDTIPYDGEENGLNNPAYCQTSKEQFTTIPNILYHGECTLEQSGLPNELFSENDIDSKAINNPVYDSNTLDYKAIPNPVYDSNGLEYKTIPNPVYGDSTLEKGQTNSTDINATYCGIPNPVYGGNTLQRDTEQKSCDNKEEHTYEQLPSFTGQVTKPNINNYDYIDPKRSPQPVVMETPHNYDYINNN